MYEVVPETVEQTKFLHTLSQNEKFDFWKESRKPGLASHVMVAPEEQSYFELILRLHGLLNFKISVADVERFVPLSKLIAFFLIDMNLV